MTHNIGTIEVIHPNKVLLLEPNSTLRYKGPKFIGLKRSIKKKGVLSPVDIGRLNGKDHVANGNRRVTICREIGIKEIRAVVHTVKNQDELCELFMELTLNTQQIGAVQLTDMYLKGMNSKYLTLSIRKSIQKLNDIYKTTTKSNAVLKRMVNINKSPRSYVIALEKLIEYVDTDETKTNEFAKKILYWMLNIQKSAWDVTYCIKASCPIELLIDSINNREEIADDWWVNV